MYVRILLLLTILQMFNSIKGSENTADEKKTVCYFAAINTSKKTLSPEDMDTSICTHIVFLHGAVKKETEEIIIQSAPNVHPSGGESYTERLAKLKEANPNLKLLLCVYMNSVKWMLNVPAKRARLIQSAVALLKASRFDGLDMEANPQDDQMDSYATFICEMNAEFAKYGYIVSTSATGGVEPNTVKQEIQRMSRCSSFISLLLEDSSMMNTTRILAPLNSIRETVNKAIEKGYQANKLLLTIPTFGSIYTLADITQTGVGASISGPGYDPDEYSDGYTIAYVQVARRLNDTTEGWIISRDEESNVPYGYNEDGTWMSYDDVASSVTKARYILENNLGGARFFTMEMDDFEVITGKTFPIIRAVSDTFKQAAQAGNVNP